MAGAVRKLLSGNEAIALGAYQAGVGVAAAYPGTPSTEILENFARYDGVYAEWAPNEKVALEVASGACYAGARALATMKHVGLNVAADPFFAVAITGVRGGLVVVSADDPSMHSSQNEQDNRNYARFAKVPLLEPSDSQEAYELTSAAFALSEEFDTPVVLRTTTRISHAKSVVQYVDERETREPLGRFGRDAAKLVMIPANARKRRFAVEERLNRLAAYGETFPGNRLIAGSPKLGIVTSGPAYQYAREVFPDATFLKLALTNPLPVCLIREFASRVERLIVVEELDPFLEDAIRGLGIAVEGKRFFPNIGEFSLEVVAAGARKAGLLPTEPAEAPAPASATALPVRPPVLCPGCPHAATYNTFRKLGFFRSPGVVVAGDIGCYTLGVLPPLLAIDTCGCMGASIGNALGMEKAGLPQKTVAVIGDSTFLHSGIAPLLDVVYNGGTVTTVILDNSTTAMTGHQEHAGTGRTLQGGEARAVDLERLVRGLGVEDVQVVSAFDFPALEAALSGAVSRDNPSVVIVKAPCVLKERGTNGWAVVDADKCNGCAACIRTGCPAISIANRKASIDATLCVGARCGLCVSTCPQGAISLEGVRPDGPKAVPSRN
jgi:indolepyruvate ferredoxin oxidoreductase, alpha subunit